MRLSVEGLSGARGGETVFGPVDFTLAAGDALVVTGANGSGKSTMLRVLAGLLPVESGGIVFASASDDSTGLAGSSHYLGHDNAMKTVLTLNENLAFWRSFLGGDGLPVAEALAAVDLAGLGHLPFGYLSTGQRRRAAIARMLVSRRPVWLVDEPTSGLDHASEATFAALVERQRADGGIVIAATHQPLALADARTLDLSARC